MIHLSHETWSREVVAPKADRRLAAAGLVLFVLAAQFMTAIMLASSMAPGYDIATGAISDLGVNAVTAGLFNASLVLTGVLNLLGGVLLYRGGQGGPTLALHALASVGAIGAGLVTLETPDLHGLFALLAFVFFNFQVLAHAARLGGALRWIGVALGSAGLTFVAVMALGDAGDPSWFGVIGHGGTERMIVYPPMLWLMAFGGALMGAGTRWTAREDMAW